MTYLVGGLITLAILGLLKSHRKPVNQYEIDLYRQRLDRILRDKEWTKWEKS